MASGTLAVHSCLANLPVTFGLFKNEVYIFRFINSNFSRLELGISHDLLSFILWFKKISYCFNMNFKTAKRYLNLSPSFFSFSFLNHFKHHFDWSRNQTLIFWCTFHCMSFPCSSLAIGKNTYFETIKCRLNQISYFIKNFFLSGVRTKNSIKFKFMLLGLLLLSGNLIFLWEVRLRHELLVWVKKLSEEFKF